MKKVTIISFWSSLRGGKPFRYDILVPLGETVEETLECAYAVTNRDGRPYGKQACSTTAGDVMCLDGQHYLVEARGFRAITEKDVRAIEQHPNMLVFLLGVSGLKPYSPPAA